MIKVNISFTWIKERDFDMKRMIAMTVVSLVAGMGAVQAGPPHGDGIGLATGIVNLVGVSVVTLREVVAPTPVVVIPAEPVVMAPVPVVVAQAPVVVAPAQVVMAPAPVVVVAPAPVYYYTSPRYYYSGYYVPGPGPRPYYGPGPRPYGGPGPRPHGGPGPR